MMSVVAPAVVGTMMRTGRVGQDCATAAHGAAMEMPAATSAAAARCRNQRRPSRMTRLS